MPVHQTRGDVSTLLGDNRQTHSISIAIQTGKLLSMRIVIIASGSRGDVEPYVALGKGLQAAGHVVRLVTHRDFESLVTRTGSSSGPSRAVCRMSRRAWRS